MVSGRRSERQPGHSPGRFLRPTGGQLAERDHRHGDRPARVATLRGNVPSLGRADHARAKGRPDSGGDSGHQPPERKARHDRAQRQAPAPPVPAELPQIAPRTPVASTLIDGRPSWLMPTRWTEAARSVASRNGLANSNVKVRVRDGVASITGRCRRSTRRCSPSGRPAHAGVREVEDRLEFVVPEARGSIPSPKRDDPRMSNPISKPRSAARSATWPTSIASRSWRLARPERDPRPRGDRNRFDADHPLDGTSEVSDHRRGAGRSSMS